MNPKKMPAKVLRLVIEEGCNTSGDIANALNITVKDAAFYVGYLVRVGHLKRTGARINREGPGRNYLVFEAAGR